MRSAVLLAVAACGTSPGSGTLTGTVNGTTLVIGDVVSARAVPSGAASYGAVALTTRSGVCADLSAGIERKNDTMVVLTMKDATVQPAGFPTGPGTFTIGVTDQMSIGTLSVVVTDASCAGVAASSKNAVSGTIQVTSVSDDVYRGSFSATLDGGDTITGTFDPDSCPALGYALTGEWAPSCQ